jgi:hypothetical protein
MSFGQQKPKQDFWLQWSIVGIVNAFIIGPVSPVLLTGVLVWISGGDREVSNATLEVGLYGGPFLVGLLIGLIELLVLRRYFSPAPKLLQVVTVGTYLVQVPLAASVYFIYFFFIMYYFDILEMLGGLLIWTGALLLPFLVKRKWAA